MRVAIRASFQPELFSLSSHDRGRFRSPNHESSVRCPVARAVFARDGRGSIHLTVEAKKRFEESGLSRRELARRPKTSVPQLYRLLDTINTRKSINQLVSLLPVLNCSVDLVVTDKEAVA